MFPPENRLLFRSVRASTNFSGASSPATENAARSSSQLTSDQSTKIDEIIKNSARPPSQPVNERPVSSVNKEQSKTNSSSSSDESEINEFCSNIKKVNKFCSDIQNIANKCFIDNDMEGLRCPLYQQYKRDSNIVDPHWAICKKIDSKTLNELVRVLSNLQYRVSKRIRLGEPSRKDSDYVPPPPTQCKEDLTQLEAEIKEDLRWVKYHQTNLLTPASDNSRTTNDNKQREQLMSSPSQAPSTQSAYPFSSSNSFTLAPPIRTPKRLAEGNPDSLVPPSSPEAKKQRRNIGAQNSRLPFRQGSLVPNATSAVHTTQPNTDSSSSAGGLNIDEFCSAIEKIEDNCIQKQDTETDQHIVYRELKKQYGIDDTWSLCANIGEQKITKLLKVMGNLAGRVRSHLKPRPQNKNPNLPRPPTKEFQQEVMNDLARLRALKQSIVDDDINLAAQALLSLNGAAGPLKKKRVF
jgi:hypothetical protein